MLRFVTKSQNKNLRVPFWHTHDCEIVGLRSQMPRPGEVASSLARSRLRFGSGRWLFVMFMDEASLEIVPFKRPDSEHDAVGDPPKGQRRCIVVAPKKAAPGYPWSWQGCYWNHEPQTEVELLRRGFHIAFITPDPGKQWDGWYACATRWGRRLGQRSGCRCYSHDR